MYTTNPKMPKIRRDAVLFANKHGVRCAARHFGFSPGAIVAWRKQAKMIGLHPIPTASSRPRSHPKQLSDQVTATIVAIRLEHNRSAEVVHKRLRDERGIAVSLSTVKRTLDRRGLTKKRSPWKRFHYAVPRPEVLKPGDLVQVDTIHIMTGAKTRIYVFTCLDVYSRWAYARAYAHATTRTAIDFLKRAQMEALFTFTMIQSDNGPEFGNYFTRQIPVEHRHSRVRRPNDNAHLERFNRTLQTECITTKRPDLTTINTQLPDYLRWYNEQRHHFGLKLETPAAIIKCSQAID